MAAEASQGSENLNRKRSRSYASILHELKNSESDLKSPTASKNQLL
jgi:hypothetical protein